jgi:hypothetical protein
MKLPYNCLILALAVLANVPGALPAKSTRTLTITADSIWGTLRAMLGNLEFQLDQTNNPTHTQTITSSHVVCAAALDAEKAACRANCKRDLAGDPTLYKMCIAGCDVLQDCHTECGMHATASFIKFPGAMKQALTKTCSVPTDTCPRCKPGDNVSVVDDYDASTLLPVPLFRQDIGIGPIVCDLTRFGVNLSLSRTPGFDESVTVQFTPTQGLRMNIKAFADDPTLKCHGTIGIDATLRSPNFDFYIKPSVTKHLVSWAVSAAFHAHVDYEFDSSNNLDSTVSDKVGGIMAQAIQNNQDSLNKGLTAWLLRQISVLNKDEVDDVTSFAFSSTSMIVSYTPKCVNGACSCTQSCNGANICEPNYWDDHSPRHNCTASQVCLPSGDCCQPSCGACGDDGCGKTCPNTCPVNTVCSSKKCVPCDEGPCNTACKKTKCGTWCGTCKPGFFCDVGGCKDSRNARRLFF